MHTSTTTLLLWGLAGGAVTGAVFGLGALIINTVQDEPDIAGCKTAMRKQFQDSTRQATEATTAGTGTPSTRPPQCEGVDDATLQRLTEEILTEAVNG